VLTFATDRTLPIRLSEWVSTFSIWLQIVRKNISKMVLKSRVTILVKASPQPSKSHRETVCCAGLDPNGNWKRLFPIRFRQLSDEQSFRRWSIVDFKYSAPKQDIRPESCRVHEESITVKGYVRDRDRKAGLVYPAIKASEIEAASQGHSLTVIKPYDVSLKHRRRSIAELEDARTAFEKQARQASMFDKDLDFIEPCPFEFKMSFKDGDDKRREKLCGDWETQAAFFNFRIQHGEAAALKHLEDTYCDKYFRTGLIFALGNMASRPQTWQLLGIFPLPDPKQQSFF